MFEFLFNEPQAVWRQATWLFATGWSVAALAGAWLGALVLIVLSLARLELSPARRFAVGLLQALVAAIALTMLWQPALEVRVAEAGENTVAWVLDNSASMTISDRPARPARLEQAQAVLERATRVEQSGFQASRYLFGERLEAVPAFDELPPAASRTGIAGALDTLLDTVREQALAAVVLVSDGADNMAGLSADWWQSVRAAGVPVHTVGVGQLDVDNDVELSDVRLPARVSPDSRVVALVTLKHSRPGPVRLRVTAGEELLQAEDIVLSADRREVRHELAFPSGEAGVRELEFSVSGDTPDTLPGNDRQPRVMRVLDNPQRVLYVEGEPRWEYKFLRRALAGEPDVQIVSLLRTSPNKFYRQGVRDASELADGFPSSRAALFAYDAVIIGSLEAAELDAGQQANLRDFVNLRGGSLLMLAGRSGLADGGWGRSVVAAALPVSLSSRRINTTYSRSRTRVMPTQQGMRTRWLALADDAAENEALWAALPEVADQQALGEPKTGAVTLLAREQQGGTAPLLVWHRYGQGQSFVLGTSGTWRWQMSMPSTDTSHERFWRQLIKRLVASALPRLTVHTGADVYRDASSAEVRVLARNADFTPLSQSTLNVVLARSDGRREPLELRSVPGTAGLFQGSVPLTTSGPFAIRATTPVRGEAPADDLVVERESWSVAERGSAELFDAGQNRGLLERIAAVTGGQYLELADADELPAVLAATNAALTRGERLPLWNMPVFFLLLFAAKMLEWLLRLRWKRL